MTVYAYRVVVALLSPDDGGGFIATVRDLPGCRSDGDNPNEALDNVYDAIGEWIDAARSLGKQCQGRA